MSGDAGKLTSLKQLLDGSNATKRQAVVGHMAKALIPIMEKSLLHPPMTHR